MIMVDEDFAWFDLDGVVYDYQRPLINRINIKYHTSYKYEDFLKSDASCFFNSTKELDNFWVENFSDPAVLYNVPLFSSYIPAMIAKVREKKKVGFCTARGCGTDEPSLNKNITIEILARDKIVYDKICVGRAEEKYTQIKGPGSMVDDHPNAIVNLSKIPLLKLFMVTRPWNKDFDEKKYGCTRICSVFDYCDYLLNN
jgi:uncharacterized HAD superfamily protein